MERGWVVLCYSVGRNLDNLVVGDGGSHFGGGFSLLQPSPLAVSSQTPPHFGGGFSRVTAHSFSSPPWWGCVDLRLALDPHPPRGGFSGSFSAIARASLLAPPLWGWVKRIPSAPQRGGFSCYRPTIVGVCPYKNQPIPVGVRRPGSATIAPPAWGCLAFASRSPPAWESICTT
jgi:hypothetical protein